MCLIAFGWRAHPRYDLVVAANRDEFFARPAAPAGFWQDAPSVFAGRDLQAGGAWCGVNAQRRFAAVTNFRDLQADAGERSRGDLVAGFLREPQPGRHYAEARWAARQEYGGFNLLLADQEDFFYLNNRDQQGVQGLTPGLHALSNGVLGDSWPKTEKAKAGLRAAMAGEQVDVDALFTLLADSQLPSDRELPDTGVGLDRERMLGAVFVRGEIYGTRASTVILRGVDGSLRFEERSFDAEARLIDRQEQQWPPLQPR